MKSHKHKKRTWIKDFSHFFPFFIIIKLLGLIPFRITGKIGYTMGIVIGMILRPRYEIAYKNLLSAYNHNISKRNIRITIFKIYGNIGKIMAECSWMVKLNSKNVHKYFVLKGENHFKNALSKNKGVIFLTAHFSNWEIMAVAHALIWGIPTHIIAKHIKNRFMDKLVEKYRTACGNKIIYKEKAIWQSIRILKRGGVLGILMDQNISNKEGIRVKFFGIPTNTIPTIAHLALRTGASVIPVFIYPDKTSKYVIEYGHPLKLYESGDIMVDIHANIQYFNDIIEHKIREKPYLWLWTHKRWRTIIE